MVVFAWGEDAGVDRGAGLASPGVSGVSIGLARSRPGRCKAGLVDVDLADIAGERFEERPNGLLTGMDVRLEELRADPLGVSLSFRNGDGVLRDNGLKLCPMIVSRRCVSEFQRGLGPGLSVGVFTRAWLANVPAVAREGVKSRRDEGRDLRGGAAVLCGMLEYRRFAGITGLDDAALG